MEFGFDYLLFSKNHMKPLAERLEDRRIAEEKKRNKRSGKGTFYKFSIPLSNTPLSTEGDEKFINTKVKQFMDGLSRRASSWFRTKLINEITVKQNNQLKEECKVLNKYASSSSAKEMKNKLIDVVNNFPDSDSPIQSYTLNSIFLELLGSFSDLSEGLLLLLSSPPPSSSSQPHPIINPSPVTSAVAPTAESSSVGDETTAAAIENLRIEKAKQLEKTLKLINEILSDIAPIYKYGSIGYSISNRQFIDNYYKNNPKLVVELNKIKRNIVDAYDHVFSQGIPELDLF